VLFDFFLLCALALRRRLFFFGLLFLFFLSLALFFFLDPLCFGLFAFAFFLFCL
jgi:hypothetical protein